MKRRIVIALIGLGLGLSCTPNRSTSPDQGMGAIAGSSPAASRREGPSGEPGTGPKGGLKATVEKVWNARVNRDCATVAKYYDPIEYAANTQDERLEICEQDPFRYVQYRIDKVEEEGVYGWAHIHYDVKYARFPAEPAQGMDTVEKWKRIEGVWYPVPARIVETCPEPPSLRDAAEEVRLRERFQKTWELRLARDWKSLYELTDPKDRGHVAESQYAESEGLIQYFAHDLEWVQVMGDIGEIRVTYDNKLNDPNMSKMRGRKINLSEHWVKRNGEWYRDLLRNP